MIMPILSLMSSSGTSSTSSPGYNDNKYIVFEKNLMELFEKCPNCRRAAEVKTFRRGTFLSVDQRCHHCNFIKHWESQPLMGSSPVGNLQLSAAVYCTGSSFNQVQKVKCIMHFSVTLGRGVQPSLVYSTASQPTLPPVVDGLLVTPISTAPLFGCCVSFEGYEYQVT